MNLLMALGLMLTLSSCTYFSENFDSPDFKVQGASNKNISILISGNINGETQPCGCRHHPLGGLPQVAGLHHKLKKKKNILIVDAGDTFFPSSTIPSSLRKSFIFAAKSLSTGLDKLGLNYFTPGDQDFAAGIEFLQELAINSKFKFLISNLRSPSIIKHVPFAHIENGPHQIFLIGLVNPDSLLPKDKKYFLSSERGFQQILKTISKNGFQAANPFHRLIVVSHAGLDDDKSLARKHSEIDWIIGAHSQSFIRIPVEENKSKIVQVLSRNHYLGEISLSSLKDKTHDSYVIHEIRDQLAKEIKNNPFRLFIDQHQTKLHQIRLQEQEQMTSYTEDKSYKYASSQSCLECHEPQGEHWKSTPHALAFQTLVNKKQDSNPSCIGCHSLGFNGPHGFVKNEELIIFDDQKSFKKDQIREKKRKYLKEFQKAFSFKDPVRSMSAARIKKLVNTSLSIDRKHSVAHNFKNVNCLNCHDLHNDHPFTTKMEAKSHKNTLDSYQKKCLSCHNPDQSPEWYDKDERGLARKLNKNKLLQKIKKMGH